MGTSKSNANSSMMPPPRRPRKERLRGAERERLMGFLLFRLKHGGNVTSAIKSYLENNDSKESRPVAAMLDRLNKGAAFHEVAYEFGLVDQDGWLLLDNAPNVYQALQSLRDSQDQGGAVSISRIWLNSIIKQWFVALSIALVFIPPIGGNNLMSLYQTTNMAAQSAGTTPHPIPYYITHPWSLLVYVLIAGVLLLFGWLTLKTLERNNAPLIYRWLRFRFYEDWRRILDVYLMLKQAGHSDAQSVKTLARIAPNEFTRKLFEEAALSMSRRGRGLYELLASHRGTIPSIIVNYFMDGEKTGQRDIYVCQARDYCIHSLEEQYRKTKIWVPVLLANINLLIFGLMFVDLTIDLTNLIIKPMM